MDLTLVSWKLIDNNSGQSRNVVLNECVHVGCDGRLMDNNSGQSQGGLMLMLAWDGE